MFVDDAENRTARSDDWPEELETALAPEPLPEALVRRIRADWDRRGGACRRGLPIRWFAPLAAAAAITIAFVLPQYQTAPPERTAAGSVALSPREAAEIVAAFDVLRWDSVFDEDLKTVSAAVASIDRDLREQRPKLRDGRMGGDDWDVPPPESKPRSYLEAEVARGRRETLGRMGWVCAVGGPAVPTNANKEPFANCEVKS